MLALRFETLSRRRFLALDNYSLELDPPAALSAWRDVGSSSGEAGEVEA